ncbi:sulfite exporter TauE/SafE family protein [Nocardia colli]|uniref:Probable membrane transporter protein n=1 Tax=Nocardia colli TaxID=2545717 RepID=A0A5N0DXR9_9NOCA|nr:sulfite exporter TauE/SafE family protein [Nocardia colli]KAA8881922.1 sulfite exporter TauE/SafE family protein [Nocardia colli]
MGVLLLVPLGFVCGVVASTAGSPSLFSFPLLLAAGYPAVAANVTNTVGMVMPTTLGGSLGYRDRLREEGRSAWELALAGGLGGGLGGGLLLLLGERVFEAVIPSLLIGAAVLVLVGPWIVRRAARSAESVDRPRIAVVVTFVLGIYGGYFGAGVGPLLVSSYVITFTGGIQRSNALKVLVVLAVNITATMLFALFGPVDWLAVAALGVAGVAGGYVGARTARRMPDSLLRAAVATSAAIAASLQIR